jgi:hypothetical protein
MGIHQTAPAWATFTVRPRLAQLQFANVTVPTIRGPIVVAARPNWLSVAVPCNTHAKLCVFRGGGAEVDDHAGGGAQGAAEEEEEEEKRGSLSAEKKKRRRRVAMAGVLLLDGIQVEATLHKFHLCSAGPVSCALAPRVLSIRE